MRFHQQTSLEINYPVLFHKNIFSLPVQDFWRDVITDSSPAKAIFYIDANVAKAHSCLKQHIRQWLGSFAGLKADALIKTVVPGESLKNDFSAVMEIAAEMASEKLCRHSYVFIIGGGAVIDAVGFAASITHRGIRQVRIPTTVLSQDDSAVGVKNGINFSGLKNLFGTFYPPHSVICDSSFLATLSDRDWVAGVAEAFKVAIIKDIDFLCLLSENAEKIPARSMEFMEQVVRRSAEIHLNHIGEGGDPFETGSSRPLDFGHWSAHKLEAMSNTELRHGEAVAIGIALDLCCCVEMDLLQADEAEQVVDAMNRCGLPVWSDLLEQESDGRLAVIDGLEEFREHIGGVLTLTMPDGLGQKIDIHNLPPEKIVRAVARLKTHVT